MPRNNESQCYFIQLQIDGYLDGELSDAQQNVFILHVQDCVACASEFRYAQTVQDAVLEFPQIECKDSVLTPIDQLTSGAADSDEGSKTNSMAEQLAELVSAVPLYIRYGFSAALVAVVAVLVVGISVVTPLDVPEQLVQSESAVQYSPEEISLALQELNLAIDYLNKISQRTEVMIGDRFLVSPIQDSVNASFQKANLRENDLFKNGPI
jgi:hypothetical protein